MLYDKCGNPQAFAFPDDPVIVSMASKPRLHALGRKAIVCKFLKNLFSQPCALRVLPAISRDKDFGAKQIVFL